MSLVVLEHVSLHFGGKRIVEDLNLRIAEGDRIGLIGPNGSGKTTLLRLMAGDQAPDGGSLRTSRGIRIGWLPQDIAVEGGRSLLDLVLSGVPGRAAIEEELTQAETDYAAALESGGDEEALLELAGTPGRAARAARPLRDRSSPSTRPCASSPASASSPPSSAATSASSRAAGRCAACSPALLFSAPDVLLLDEPTNHLDMPSVAWFGDFLKRYPRPFVLISHDREFLNEQIARVASLEVEGVAQYPGNYETLPRATGPRRRRSSRQGQEPRPASASG